MKTNRIHHLSAIVIIFLTLIPIAVADCRVPHPVEGTEVLIPEWKSAKTRTVSALAIIIYKCQSGYERSLGDSEAICIGQRLKLINSTRNAIPLICRRKQCQVPKFENGNIQRIETRVRFQCNQGYKLNGSSVIHCFLNNNGDYVLRKEPPKCEPIQKCPTISIKNSRFKNPPYYEGDVVKVFCISGYNLQGRKFLKCLSSGEWNDTLPTCNYIPSCKDPGIPLHGSRNGSCCRTGSVLYFHCNRGFEFENNKKKYFIECLNSEIWSAPRPKCKPKGTFTCGVPDLEAKNLQIVNERRPDFNQKLEVYLSGSEIELMCKENYETEEEDEMYLWCYEGRWDAEFPTCLPKRPCKRPNNPMHGKIEELAIDDRQEFPLGFEINIICDEGYSIKQGQYGSICLGNDRWSGGYIPNCTEIFCNNPGIPENGAREGDSFKIGSQVKFSCHSGYTLLGSKIRVCQTDGQWNGELAVCDSGDTYCPNPGIPINGYRKGSDFNLGDEIVFSCKKDFHLLGTAVRRCLKGHAWSGEEVLCKEFTNLEDVGNALEETMALTARSTSSSVMMRSMGRSLADMNSLHGVNIIFCFDGSGSITSKNFEIAKLFATTLIRNVGISSAPNGIQVAAILFSSEAEIVFVGSDKMTLTEVLGKLKEMKPPRKGTNINAVLNMIFGISNMIRTNRPQSKSVAFLFSDGIVTEGGDPEKRAEEMRSGYNIELFSIAIGVKINHQLLKKIAPLDNHFFHLPNYDQLSAVITQILGKKVDYSKCGLGHSKQIESSNLGRMIGGKQVQYSWPWMVALKYKNSRGEMVHTCGGTIIHSEWVLSAAHCFIKDSDSSKWKANVGMIEERTGNKTTFKHSFEVPISQILLHENYTILHENYDFDIALIKLQIQVSFDVFLRPVCLPPVYEDLPENIKLYLPGEKAMVVGWGYDKPFNRNDTPAFYSVDHAEEAVISIQSPSNCGDKVEWTECLPNGKNCQFMQRQITETMFCAGEADGSKDTCNGDSGGPLMQHILSDSGNLTDKRWIEIGIVSWGVGCAQKGFYGYYTHISKLRQWIDKTTQVKFENVIPIPRED